MGWLAGYKYRKRHDITGSAGAGTNYQRKYTIGSDVGMQGADETTLGGGCTDFPNDIRFTSGDGVTELDHWCEDLTADPAVFWVEVKDNLDDNQSIYIYFGKSGAGTASNGDDTFLFFDDFERGDDGDTIGGDWTETAPHIHISTEQKYGGTRAAKIIGGDPAPSATIPLTAASSSYAIRLRLYKEAGANVTPVTHGDGSKRLLVGTQNHTEDIRYYDGTWHDTYSNIAADVWTLFEISHIDFAAGTYSIFYNGVVVATDPVGMHTSANQANVIRIYGTNRVGDDSWVDDFIVRKWVDPEPSHDDWGPQQEAGYSIGLIIG